MSLAALLTPILTMHPTAGGADRHWGSPVGGCFNQAELWLDGFELGVPGDQDAAIFDLPSAYVVCFPRNETTDRLLVRSGALTYFLADKLYTLLNPLSDTPSVVIGEREFDTASLEITGGAVHGIFTDVGREPGAIGVLRLTGPTTQLVNDLALRLGNQGAGFLDISGGATAANGDAIAGVGVGSFGQAAVSGAGTVWICAGDLTVGGSGVGGLIVSDGAQILSDSATIGQELASVGDVRVSGPGSAWAIAGVLNVGMRGLGSLRIDDGASLTNEIVATIGTFPDESGNEEGGVGDVTVSGPGSTWTVHGDLWVGFQNYGRWTLSGGGKVVVDGNLYRGPWMDSTGAPQTVIQLSSSDDYATAAISVNGAADGFDPRVDLINGFVPRQGDEFLVATADGGLGPFDFDLPAQPCGAWQVIKTLNSVRLRIGTPGDLDADGTVDIRDLLILLSGWGICPPQDHCPADLNCDGIVGIADLLLLLVYWG
jgi:T5SS/PEP-CTERM-associated repeat protein